MPRKLWSGAAAAADLEKESFAAADFDFERRFPTEEGGRVPRLRQLVPRFEVVGEVERGVDLAESAAGQRKL